MAVLLAGCASAGVVAGAVPEAPDCPLLPADSYWYADVRDLPAHPRSADWVGAIGASDPVHPDFGSGTFDGFGIGIPYNVVGGDVAHQPVTFDFADESDPGPYPIPEDPSIEGDPNGDGDRHVLIIDQPDCVLYELYAAERSGGGWTAGSGAVFDLTSNDLRPDTWTSADAAGLPILPGLVRYDEVASGVVDHAIRMTAPRTDRSYTWPARHHAGAADDPSLPPMGAWFRLDPGIDPAGFPEQARPIVVALQTHGAVLADNGSGWFISGVPDERWDNDALRSLRGLTGADFTAVDTSSLIADPDSGRVAGTGPVPGEGLRDGDRYAGTSRIGTAVAISQAQFPGTAETVYLARADNTVDAVAGGVLTDGPILLVPACGELPDEVGTEIARLDPERIVALGGESAICEEIFVQARQR